ncbi:hypothetical protein Tco_1077746, partial [Tanacetum coccineum]
ELDLPELNNVLPFLECDSVFYEDFSEGDALPLTNNEDKVFNPEVPGLGAILLFSSENEEKVATLRFSLLKEFIPHLSRNYLIGALKLSKSPKFLKARWRFFLALTKRTFVPWMLVSPLLSPLTNSSMGD